MDVSSPAVLARLSLLGTSTAEATVSCRVLAPTQMNQEWTHKEPHASSQERCGVSIERFWRVNVNRMLPSHRGDRLCLKALERELDTNNFLRPRTYDSMRCVDIDILDQGGEEVGESKGTDWRGTTTDPAALEPHPKYPLQ
jgi:hypothetical protein